MVDATIILAVGVGGEPGYATVGLRVCSSLHVEVSAVSRTPSIITRGSFPMVGFDPRCIVTNKLLSSQKHRAPLPRAVKLAGDINVAQVLKWSSRTAIAKETIIFS